MMGLNNRVSTAAEPAAGTRETELQATLSKVYRGSRTLAEAISAVSAAQGLDGVTGQNLQALDRSLPRQTLEDMLLACEAYASVTGPSALAVGDLATMRSDAERILSRLQVLARPPRSQRGTGTTGQHQALGLRIVLSNEQVAEPLRDLIAFFSELAYAEGEKAHKRFALRIGTRFLVPGSVLAGTLALIIFLTGGIVFATGAVTFSPQGVAFSNPLGSAAGVTNATSHGTPGAQGTAGGSGSISPTGTAASGPGQAPNATATPKPSAQPTATPVPSGSPVLTVSPSDVQPCQGTDAQFSNIYSSGSGTVTWTATSPDPSNIALSSNGTSFGQQVSGTLRPGQQVTLYVRLLNDTPITGQISVTGSNGAAPTSATYDSTGC